MHTSLTHVNNSTITPNNSLKEFPLESTRSEVRFFIKRSKIEQQTGTNSSHAGWSCILKLLLYCTNNKYKE